MQRRFVLIGCGLIVVAASAFQSDSQALQRMAATERAFAAATAEIGVRDGFLTFFGEDSIEIQRGTAVTLAPARNTLLSRPLVQLPLASKLVWEPFTGQVSTDGTLGWLTGASVVLSQQGNVPTRTGAYFSVWKKQKDGAWRVWLDDGIGLPQIWLNASPFRAAPDPDAGTVGTANEAIADVERSIASDADAWRARLGADVRLHRDGLMPLVGRDAVVAWAGSRAIRYTLVRSEVAGSGDLAVTIGSMDPAAAGKTVGSWVRVWKRDIGGRWRIVFQTENAG
jgi:ketosteroid isomerase-like protein